MTLRRPRGVRANDREASPRRAPRSPRRRAVSRAAREAVRPCPARATTAAAPVGPARLAGRDRSLVPSSYGSCPPTAESASRNVVNIARPASSLGVAPTTVVRRSRNEIVSSCVTAASARSSHVARRTSGSSCSASAIIASPPCPPEPLASATARRIAGMPPRASCSATAVCSGGSEERRSSRCFVPGAKRGGRARLGPSATRSARSGTRLRLGSVPSALARFGRTLAARSRRGESGAPSGLGGLPGRGRFSSRWGRAGSRSARSRPTPRRRETSSVVTDPDPSSGAPTISIRPFGSERSRGASTETIVIPSISKDASTRTTSPTFAPTSSNLASIAPRGSFAPAARHVQVPSSRTDVNSISRRRDIRATTYLLAT